MLDQPPIRLALLGAGIFARDAHLPALQRLEPAFDLVAVYSRSLDSATALAGRLPGRVEVYTDLAALLARPDIEAVDIMLPIDLMPAVIELALQTGKHVISEKPIAPDVTTGRRLLAIHEQQAGQVWMVAENWRYEDAFTQAAEIVHTGQIGRPLLCHWALHIPITPANKYYHTAWRQAANFPGGYLVDVGVHHAAVLRLLLGEIAAVTAVTSQIRTDLPPVDSLSATLSFEQGMMGSYLVSYAVSAPWPPALYVAGEAGALAVHRQALEVTQAGVTRSLPVTGQQGVEAELAGFAAAIRQQRAHRNSPEQALQDMAVIEAMLRSAETGRRTIPERIIKNDPTRL